MHFHTQFNEEIPYDSIDMDFMNENQPAHDGRDERCKRNIQQRWSIAHLYQAILNKEEHVKNVAFLTTVAGYIHWKMTGEKVIGIGDASDMFPIDSKTKDYDASVIEKFDHITDTDEYSWKLKDILPKVLCAGENAGLFTPEGAKLLDTTSRLKAGIPVCPPEGDACRLFLRRGSIRQEPDAGRG